MFLTHTSDSHADVVILPVLEILDGFQAAGFSPFIENGSCLQSFLSRLPRHSIESDVLVASHT